MLAARQAGVAFVNVSPAASDVARELDAEWLSIRPNTDVALMLALAHTLVAEELHDRAFLERYCVGFDVTGPTSTISSRRICIKTSLSSSSAV